MSKDKKPRPAQWPWERRPGSKWWLLAKNRDRRTEMLVVECGDEQALPVFSGEGEAEVFLWRGERSEDGWQVRETSAGELISVLYGPCARVRKVALDPLPEVVTMSSLGLSSLSRDRFVAWIIDRLVLLPRGGQEHHQAGGLVKPR